MWDVRTRLFASDFAGEVMGQADYTWPGPTVVGQDLGAGVPGGNQNLGIEESGYCFTEMGYYQPILISPYIAEGCPQAVYQSLAQPEQFIHPQCGSVETTYEFTNASAAPAPYAFYTEIFGTFYPEDTLSSADSRWTGTSSHHAYDVDGPEDHRTITVTVQDLSDHPVGGGMDIYWKAGSSKRSAAITAPISVGDYLAIEVGYEYPDRIENQEIGVIGGNTNYEYYSTMSFTVYFDDSVVQHISTDGTTGNGTPVYAAIVPNCDNRQWTAKINHDNCRPDWEGGVTYKDQVDNFTDSKSVRTTMGNTDFDTYATTIYAYYYWPVSTGGGYYYGYRTMPGDAPIMLGHKGLVTFDKATGAIIQDNADPDPDLILGLAFFQAVGAGGSPFAVHQSPYNNASLKYTAGTVLDTTNDWSHSYNATTGTYSNSVITKTQKTPVVGGSEKPNGNLPGGPSITYDNGVGGYQVRNSHVCVQ
jgi:hypothetical protein